MKRARYLRPGKSWILVEILEKFHTAYRVRPMEWSGVIKENLVVSAEYIEFIISDVDYFRQKKILYFLDNNYPFNVHFSIYKL